MAIERLSDQTIAQIAAGEVVERPGSVVKELIDNALDAEASYIHVSTLAGGKRLIRITDDGVGISTNEVELAFTRHATSKLQTIADLDHISTLGFRGEALSSIASVSQLELVTRSRQDDMGVRLRIDGGRVIEQKPAGAPAGTAVSVENLFFNTPARLKFLRKESTEKKHIMTLIGRYAMAYPSVRFVLEQDRREVFRSSGSGDLADVVGRIWGTDNFGKMVAINSLDMFHDDRPSVRVSGFTSLPSLNRADRSQISLFVNGRWIQDSSLTYAIIQAYHNFLDSGRFPVSVVLIEISPTEVDVNVHPAKAEVRFRDSKAVFAAVQRAIRETLVSSVDQTHKPRRGLGAVTPDSAWRGGNFQHSLGLHISQGTQHDPKTRALEASSESDDFTNIPVGPHPPAKPRTLPMLRVVGQVGARYIVAEGPVGMYLIDQFAADSRIHYERLIKQLESEGLVRSVEIEAQTIELNRDEIRIIQTRLELLERLGIRLESFGPTTLIVRELPEELADHNAGDLVHTLLAELFLRPELDAASFISLMLQQISLLAAVKTGQVLSEEQMTRIIRQLERCEKPQQDPYGKPTLIHMSGEHLAREFGR